MTGKRILAVLLAVLLAVSCVYPVLAEEQEADGIVDTEQKEEVLEISEETFPDESFRAEVQELCDLDGDGLLSEEERLAVTTLDLSGRKIRDLTGISCFREIETLNCSGNYLTSLNLDGLEKIQNVTGTDNIWEGTLSAEGTFDLKSLPGFDVKRASDYENASVTGEGILTPEHPDAEGAFTVHYRYTYQEQEADPAQTPEETQQPEPGETKEPVQDPTPETTMEEIQETPEITPEEVQPTVEATPETSDPEDTVPENERYLIFTLVLKHEQPVLPEAVTEQKPVQAKAKTAAVKSTWITGLRYISKGRVRVNYKKISGVSGYQIVYATDSKFKNNQRWRYTTDTSIDLTSMLKANYYVKVRTYQTSASGQKIYSAYSKTKTVAVSNGFRLVDAASNSGTIYSSAIVSSRSVLVKANFRDILKSSDSYYYLFAIPSYRYRITSEMKPVQKAWKSTYPRFYAALNKDTSSSILQKKFVIAVKEKSGTYKIVTAPRYITNPEFTAAYHTAYPSRVSKKGLQINSQMMQDVGNLGIKHALINMPMDFLIASKSEIAAGSAIPFEYNGKTYYFKQTLYDFDSQVRTLCSKGITVTAVLLLRWDSQLTHLIEPSGRQAGHAFYMFNTNQAAARNQLEATFTFLAQRYSSSTSMRICNWILGNEVNNCDSNYAGTSSLSWYAKYYADSFRMLSTAVHSVYSKARIYVSMDHIWNASVSGTFKGKSFLETFASLLKQGGNIPWHIAYHAYPSPLTTPCFWANLNGQISPKLTSSVINMGNLHVLTNFVKQKYGSSHKVMLSEQGFTSYSKNKSDEKMQAAAIVYAYYVAEFDSMVDAFILHRHVDNREEMRQGLYLGLWANTSAKEEFASRKKYAWEIYRCSDTSSSVNKTKFAKLLIGVTDWKTVVPGYNAAKFRTMGN